MRDLDRIEHALAANRLSAQVFERCAQDLLSTVYEGLSPVPGGSDWGRDADIARTGDEVPVRVLITSSRGLDGVRQNMLAGIKSMKEHGVTVRRIVLANPAILSRSDRGKLAESAGRAGAFLNVSEIFDGGFFAGRLRRDGCWRQGLLGLPSGPVTLSPVAPDLAQSPWAFLPLTARAGDLASVAEAGDLILSGPPGTGKSRLLSELPGTGFVDKDAPLDSVADDLRWTQPSVVIIDDAADAEVLINRLLWLRKTEPDLFSYRLIAVCWPPDVEALQDLLPSARLHELGLMEREPLDELIQTMGVTGLLARGEILDQAEGRPAWAITLADLLLRKGDPQSLITGKALLGEAGRYLRRAGLADATDVLAAVSALGWVPEPEIRKLGEELQMPRAGLAAVLGAAARSGLIDVRSGYSDGLRAYAVRPPMLADALVAERAFFAPVAAIDLRGLASRWPDHAGELAGAVIRSAVLGAQNARPLAGELLDQALGDAEIFGHVKTSLCLEFIRLDRHAAEHVLRLTGSAAKQRAGDNADGPLDAEGTAKVAGRAAWLYQLEVAIDLLLDASLAEGLPESSRPDHPVRELERLVRVFHPEVPRPVTLRQQIARRTSQWLAQAPDDPARLRVTAAVMQIVLSLGIRSAMPHPGRPNELKMIDTIIPAGEIRQVFQEIWPLVESLLNRERPALAAAAIDVAAEWLRIGGGYDHPFGQDHPQDRLQAAQEAGEALARALAGRDDLSVGTLARLRSVVKRFDVGVAICLPEELAVFFAGTDASGGDWIEAEKVVVEAIKSAADARAGDDPDRVVTLLAEVKAELAYIPRSWPNRTMIAATRLAEVAHDPVEWLHASICHGFMPEGCIFAERLAHENRLSASDARSLLGSRSSRAEIIDILLASEPPSTPITELAADCLRSDDYLLLGKLIGRDRITPVRQSALLARPDPAFRATVAVAIFTGQPSHEDWSPGELKCAWLNALESLCPNHVLGCSGYEMASLYEYLASRYPDTLTRIITRTLSEAGEHHAYASLPHECWDILHRLPAPSKLELWRSFQDQPHMRWLLRPQLVGSDTQWLEQLLTTHEISPDEALGCYIGTQPDIPIRALAKLLIPRGIDPARIAGLRFYGQYSGNLSSWYQSIIDSFEEMSVEEDPDVRAVAGAGIKLFTAQRDQAADNERIQRIRGRA